MTTIAIWPAFLCTAIVLAFISTPAFKSADMAPTKQKNREATLDGLRGFLALAVFYHHAAIYEGFLHRGTWTLPSSRFYCQLGPFGVSLFFMITGYLFYGKLLRSGGRAQWQRLYLGRIFRIGPMYVLATGLMILTVLCLNDFQVLVPWRQFAHELGTWLSLGIVRGSNSLDGYAEAWLLLAGVTWSIHFEWMFYLSLPLLAIFSRWRTSAVALPAVTLLLCLSHLFYSPAQTVLPDRATMGAEFALGMLTAVFREHRWVIARDGPITSIIVIGIVGSFFSFSNSYAIAPILLLGFAFHLITNGASLFGLLRMRAAKRLGDISYALYLLQGLLLASFLRPLRKTALASPMNFWVLVYLDALLLVVCATLAHILVERPGVRLGIWIAQHNLMAGRTSRRQKLSA